MRTNAFSCLLLLCLCTACTTQVELCHEDHPHRSDVRMFFDFGQDGASPDSMVVFAVRNLNLLSYAFHLDATGAPSRQGATGHLISPAALREPLPTGDDRICLHPGAYELYAYNGGSGIYADNLLEIMNGEVESIDSLWLTHQSYQTTLDHPLLRRDSAWVSHNIYSDFILNADRQAVFTARSLLDIPVEAPQQSYDVTFRGTSLSQHISLEFSIQKESGIVIDSAVAELSGIPHRIYLITRAVDASRTFKTLYHPDILPADNAAAQAVTVRGSVFVNGLVRSLNPSYTTGPGILWVSVYAHAADADGTVAARPIEACINLYHLLQETPSLGINASGEAQQLSSELLLRVPGAVLDLQRRLLFSSDASGLDIWHTLPDGGADIGFDF